MKFCPKITVTASVSEKPPKKSQFTVAIYQSPAEQKAATLKKQGFPDKYFGLHGNYRVNKEK